MLLLLAAATVEDLEEEQEGRDSSSKVLAARVTTLEQKQRDCGRHLDNVIGSILRRLLALERGAQR